jgi:hypothetical protein
MVLALAGDSTITSGLPVPAALFFGVRVAGDMWRKYARILRGP